MPVLGLDVSNHQGEIRADQVAVWKSKGFEHACVRLSLERPDMIALARRQIAAFQLGGMSTSGYIWGYFDLGDPRGVAEQTVGEYGDTGVVRYYVDVEDETHSLSPAANVAWLHIHLDALMNLTVPFGIYTGRGFWRTFMGNSRDFRNVALWDGNWDGIPDLGRFVPYGGWTACLAKQYGGTGFDADIWDESVIGGEDMARIAELEAQVRDLTSWGDAVVQQNIVRRKALEDALREPTRAAEKRGVQAVINNLKKDEG
jgi:hypothetical protein